MKYPSTTVALALTEPDQTLRQLSTKATLRRLLYKKLDEIVKETPDKADLLVDGIAAVAVAYKDFADAYLSHCKPKVGTCPKILTIIFGSYDSTSTTQSTQIKRG